MAEITRIHLRFDLLNYSSPGIYDQFVIFSLFSICFALLGWFILPGLRRSPELYGYAVWLPIAWGLYLLFTILSPSIDLFPKNRHIIFALIKGLSYLFSITLSVMVLGEYVLGDKIISSGSSTALRKSQIYFPKGPGRIWIMAGVGGTTFTMIFLQIILFRMLTIFGDYLTANSVISIALLGISIGGMIGFFAPREEPVKIMIGASLMLPVTVLLAFGTVVSLINTPLLASILLMLPFVFSSILITVALVHAKSHLIYFLDLFGAGLGALLVGLSLSHFREESSLLFLCAFSFLVAACVAMSHTVRRTRTWIILAALTGAFGFLMIGAGNLQNDRLNIVRTKIIKKYPRAAMLFSRSSFVGRYDVVRRKPHQTSLKAYENGRIIDTIRKNSMEDYRIDPRVPHTLIKDPIILILGLSGDGIAKTSKFLGKKVYGVEINPAIVSLQTRELTTFNADSYKNIDVSVMDGRSFLNQSRQRYDIITLMNAHLARGRTSGRAPSPEYLHTQEAVASYLSHLTDRGVLIVEEPVSRPRREPPVWKLIVTMRQVLLERGSTDPARHFFIFEWNTKQNNYIQILLKKKPLTSAEIVKLKKWLDDVDHIKNIEARSGRRMGPIRSAKTTLLYSPDEAFENNYFRIINGMADPDFLRARNLRVTTDARPFHFDVDPARPGLKKSFRRTLLIAFLLVPFFLFFLTRYRSEFRNAVPYVLIVTLTGLGYFFVEVVLMQRYEIFLGSPVVTFSSVLGTLLIFSGLGSLWSGRISRQGVHMALGGIVGLLIFHAWITPRLFHFGAFLPLSVKVIMTIAALAPLAFFMGVPFPFVMRTGKLQVAPSTVAMLFAINAAGSALAVPLALNISASRGLPATFQIGILLYLGVGLLLVYVNKSKLRALTNGFALLILCLLLLSPWLLSRPVAGLDNNPDRFRVYAINYGRSVYREDRIAFMGSRSKQRSFSWMFWLIRGQERTMLVDTGFEDPEMVERWKIFNYVRPIERLKQIGINPLEVSDVILTHAHRDHIDGLARYKNATVWIQEDEYRHVQSTGNMENSRAKNPGRKHLQALRSAEKAGRLKQVRGTKELIPGVTLTLAGDHTPGSQYITVNTLDGPVILAGDSSYMYRNIKQHRPIGTAVDRAANLTSIREMHRTAGSTFLIIPGHDPRVMRWFPKVAEGVVQITTIPE